MKKKAGFMLWECLLASCISLSVLLAFSHFWLCWVRMRQGLLQRLRAIEVVRELPLLLSTHWVLKSDVMCSGRLLPYWLQQSPAEFHHQYPHSLFPDSSVLLERFCDSVNHVWEYRAYFLAHGTLYEKEQAKPAKGLVSGLSAWECDVHSKKLLGCRYSIFWPAVLSRGGRYVFFHIGVNS